MSGDLLTQLALLVAASASIFVFAARRSPAFGIAGGAFIALSVDEASDIHERLGRSMGDAGVQARLVQDLDSLVLAAYGLILAALFLGRWRTLTAAPLGTTAMGGAFVLGGAAVAMDMFVPKGFPGAHGEEYLEAGAACLLAAVFVSHAGVTVSGSLARLSASRALAQDVAAVLDDVPHGHALDDRGQGAGHAAG
ncbi:MAG: hypothetical protein ACRDHF_09525 [Tepidiformaceae bacterium]